MTFPVAFIITLCLQIPVGWVIYWLMRKHLWDELAKHAQERAEHMETLFKTMRECNQLTLEVLKDLRREIDFHHQALIEHNIIVEAPRTAN